MQTIFTILDSVNSLLIVELLYLKIKVFKGLKAIFCVFYLLAAADIDESQPESPKKRRNRGPKPRIMYEGMSLNQFFNDRERVHQKPHRIKHDRSNGLKKLHSCSFY